MKYLDPDGRELVADSNIKNYLNDGITYLSKSESARFYIYNLTKTPQKVYIKEVNGVNKDRFDPNTNTIYWDPLSTILASNDVYNSPAVCLAHEFVHAFLHTEKGKKILDKKIEQIRIMLGVEKFSEAEKEYLIEQIVTKEEQKIANELNEYEGRKDYFDYATDKGEGIEVKVSSPSQFGEL